MPPSGTVWYLDGKMAPEIWMQRGLTYSIYVYGGNNPHNAENYNPLIITDEPHGGYEHLSEQAQKQVKVLAGVQFTLRGQPRPVAGNTRCFCYIHCYNNAEFEELNLFLVYNKGGGIGCITDKMGQVIGRKSNLILDIHHLCPLSHS